MENKEINTKLHGDACAVSSREDSDEDRDLHMGDLGGYPGTVGSEQTHPKTFDTTPQSCDTESMNVKTTAINDDSKIISQRSDDQKTYQETKEPTKQPNSPSAQTGTGNNAKTYASHVAVNPLNKMVLKLRQSMECRDLEQMKLLVTDMNSSIGDETCITISRSTIEDIQDAGSLFRKLKDLIPDENKFLDILMDLFVKIERKDLARMVKDFKQEHQVSQITQLTSQLSLSLTIKILTDLPEDVRDPFKITSFKTLYRTADGHVICANNDPNKKKLVSMERRLWTGLLDQRSDIDIMYARYKNESPKKHLQRHVVDDAYVLVDKFFGKIVLHYVSLNNPNSISSENGVCFRHPGWENFLDYLSRIRDKYVSDQ